jgi:WhiB family redox-sensing transcriptional regulator
VKFFETRDSDGNELAKCTQKWVDPEFFFDPLFKDLAISICEDCPLQKACLQFSIDNQITDGVWGGLTEEKRRLLIKRRVRLDKNKG